MKYSIHLILATFIAAFSGFSQENDTSGNHKNRLEIETDKNLSHKVIPYGEKLIVITDNERKEMGKKFWKVNIYDNKLEALGEVIIEPKSSINKLKAAKIVNEHLFLLMQYYRSNQMYEQALELYKIDLNTLGLQDLEYEKPIRNPKENTNSNILHVIGENYFITGYIASGFGYEGETFVHINPGSDQEKVLYVKNELMNSKRNQFYKLLPVLTDKDKELIAVAVSVKLEEGSQGHVFIFNIEGEIESSFNTSTAFKGEDVKLSSLNNTYVSDDQNIYIGTYVTPESAGKKALNFFGISERGDAEGLYFIKETNGKISEKKLVSFLELEKFEKIARSNWTGSTISKNNKGEEVFSSEFLTYDLIRMGEKIFFIGETYNPVTQTYMDNNGNMRERLIGHDHNFALIICFDQSLEICYHEVVPIHEFISGSLYRILSIDDNEEDNSLRISWSGSKTRCTYTVSSSGIATRDEQITFIETDNESEKIKKSTNSYTMQWYDGNYIITGKQKIKDRETGKKRYVFYINHYEYSTKD